jgi:hypothetical protein
VRDAFWANLGCSPADTTGEQGERRARPEKSTGVDTRYGICETQSCCRFSRNRAELCVPCRSGGIGRRAWFRSTYSQGCGGSSPFFGTNPSQINDLSPWRPSLVSTKLRFWCPLWCPLRRARLRELLRRVDNPPMPRMRRGAQVNMLKRVRTRHGWRLCPVVRETMVDCATG